MTSKKTTRRALFSSVISLILCCAMLIGTTFAWFTDSVTSGRNIIKAGKLDVEMYYTEDLESEWADASEATIFDYQLWEPGYSDVKYVKIANVGNLAFKYRLSILPDVVAAEGEANLADVIDVYFGIVGEGFTAPTDFSEVSDKMYVGTLSDLMADPDGIAYGALLPEDGAEDFALPEGMTKEEFAAFAQTGSVTACIILHMQEEAGNEYQELSVGEGFSVQLLATQLTYENDSFDNMYDENADFVAYFTSGTHEVNTTLMATKATDVITATGEGTVVNITGGYYDAGDQDCAVWAKDGATVNIYDGTFIHNGNADGSEADSANHFDMIYAGANGGKINIYGGHYSARNNGVWLLNEKDSEGEIVVYGGTFVNWNPANNVSEGAGTNFLADGYKVVEKENGNDTWYYVVPEGSELVGTTDELEEALTNGTDAILTDDISMTDTLEVAGDTVIDLNGYNLDASANASRPFEMADGASLTINGGDEEIEVGAFGLVNIPAGNDATVVLNGGKYSANLANGSFIKPRGDGAIEIVLNDVEYTDSSNDSWVLNSNGYTGEMKLVVSGGEYKAAGGFIIQKNVAEGSKIDGATIENTDATNNFAAIGSYSDISITNSTVITAGHGIAAGFGATVIVDNCKVEAPANGYAFQVYSSGGTINVTNTTYTGIYGVTGKMSSGCTAIININGVEVVNKKG